MVQMRWKTAGKRLVPAVKSGGKTPQEIGAAPPAGAIRTGRAGQRGQHSGVEIRRDVRGLRAPTASRRMLCLWTFRVRNAWTGGA
jgi:hypothetical protein